MISNKEITWFQLIFVLIHSQIGIGVISLPFDVFMKAKADSWMSVLLAGIIIQLTIFIFGALMFRFPSTHLYGIVQLLFGKWVGKVIIALYSIYFIFLGGIFLAKFVVILKTWMMPLTPKWLLVALMLILAVYIVMGDIQIIARFFVLSSIVIVVFIGFAAYAFKNANFTHVFPVGNMGILPIIKGIEPTMYSFQGFELLLFIYPFVQSSKKGLLKAATIANIFVTLFYTLIVITNQLFFSPDEMKMIPEPILYLTKAYTFKIVERPDLLFTSMWIVLVSTTIIIGLYAASFGLSVVMNSNSRNINVLIAAIISFILAMSVSGEYEIAALSSFFNPFIFIFAFVFPTLLLIIAIIFKKKEGETSG